MPHLPPAHHETSKHDSPNETKRKEKKRKEKQNETVPDSNSNLAKSAMNSNLPRRMVLPREKPLHVKRSPSTMTVITHEGTIGTFR
jgi:hypothetical protein